MKNKIILSAFILYLFASIISLVPNTAFAADTYKWGNNNHDTITSSGGVVYNQLGYTCTTVILNNDKTLNDKSLPTAGDISTSYSNEAASGVTKVPGCNANTDYPAHFIWMSNDKSSYIVVKDGGDNKLTGIGNPYRGKASLWSVNGTTSKFVSDVSSITKPDNNTAPNTEQTREAVAESAAATSNEPNEDCNATISVFGWLLCPIMYAVAEVVEFFENTIQTLLRMNEISANSPIYTSWASIRNVARSLLVLVALAAIASQIFGFEFMNAYTVRKLIPKIIIAAILLELSFFLAATGVSFVNALGDGVEALILYPFGDSPGELLAKANEGSGAALYYIIDQFEDFGAGSSAVAGILLVGMVGAAVAGGLMALVMSIFFIIAAVFVGFVTIVLRKIVLLGLVIIMPLAIVAWILPNTKKYYDSWWSLFSKLLLMYPLIMGLLAVGKAGAYIIASASAVTVSSASIFSTFAADSLAKSVVLFAVIIAYFGPFFFIPAMFKTAGGLFAKGHSALNGMGKKYSKAAGDSKPMKNLQESYRTRKVNKATANAGMNVGKNPYKYLRRTKARSTLGTLGAVGDYGTTKRREERQNALKKSSESFFESMREQGITDYDDQLSYAQAMAHGESVAYKRKGNGQFELDSSGNKIEIGKVRNPYNDVGVQTAATFLAGQQKAGRNRAMFTELKRQGKDGIISDVMAEKAGDIKKVSADVVGKPFSALKTEEIVTQDASSLKELYRSDIHNAVNSGDFSKVQTMLNQITAAKSSEIYHSATDESSRNEFDRIERQLQSITTAGAPNFETAYRTLNSGAPANAPINLHDAPGDSEAEKARKAQARRQFDIKLVGDSDY